MYSRKSMWFAALLLAAMPAHALYAADGDVYVVVDASSLRNGPDSDYSPIATLKSGDRVREIAVAGDWVKVRQDGGQEGWLYAASLQRLPASSSTTRQSSKQRLAPDVVVADPFAMAAAPLEATPTVSSRSTGKKVLTSEPAVVQSPLPDPALTPLLWDDAVFAAQQPQEKDSAVATVADKTTLPRSHTVEEASSVVGHANSRMAMATDPFAASPASQDVVAAATGADARSGDAGKQTSQSLQSDTPTPSVGEPIRYRFNSRSKLRRAADASSDVIGWAGQDAYVRELGRQGNWVRVEMEVSRRTGWVYSQVLTPVPSQAMAVAANPEESTPPKKRGGAAQQVNVADVLSKAVPVAAEVPVNRAPEVVPVHTGVTVEHASTEQDTGSGSMASALTMALPQKTEAIDSGSLPQLPVQPEVSPAVSVPASQAIKPVYRFTGRSRLRAGPGSGFDVVGWAGLDALASEQKRQGDWIRIEMQVSKRVGWVYKGVVTEVPSAVDANVNPAVLPKAAPELAAHDLATHDLAVSSEPPVPVVGEGAPARVAETPAAVLPGLQTDTAEQAVPAQPQITSPDRSAGPTIAETMPVATGEPHQAVETSQSGGETQNQPATASVGTDAVQARPLYRFSSRSKLRSGPDANDEVVGWAGADALASEQQRQGDWIKVEMQVSKRVGWVYKGVVTEVPSAVDANVNPAVLPKAAPELAAHDLAVSSEPSVPVVGEGAPARVAETPAAVLPGLQTDTAEQAVPAQPQIASPDRSAAPTIAETMPVATGEPHQAAGTSQSGGETQNQPAAASVGTDAVQARPLYRFSSRSKLRSGPDANDEVVGWAGADALASEQQRQGDWIKVEMQVSKRSGWVYKGVLSPLVPAEVGTPAAADSAVDAVAAASKKVAGQGWPPEAATVITPDVAVSGKQPDTTEPVSQIAEQQSDSAAAMAQRSRDMAAVDALPPAPKEVAVVAADTVGSQPVSGQENMIMQTTPIRSGPGSLFEVLGWAGSGASVVPMASQGKWVNVRMRESGRVGWIDAAALREQAVVVPQSAPLPMAIPEVRPVASDAAVPTVAPEPVEKAALPAETSADIGKLCFFNRTSNLQAGPSDAAGRIGWVGQNESATVLESQGDWRKVKMTISGAEGWVPRSLLLAALEPVNGETIAPVVVKRPLAEVKKPQVETVAAAPVAAVKAVEAKVAEVPTEMQMLVGADNRVTHPTVMRSGPSPLYEVSGWLGKDAALVAISQQGDWVHVRLHDGGRDGWIEAPLLQLPVVKTGEVAAAMPLVPLQQTAARVAAAPAVAATDEVGKLWFFNRTGNLQAGPSDAAGRIGWVGQNESATVLESQGDWRKVKMTISGAEGWVPRSLLLAALEPVNGETIAPVVVKRPLAEVKKPQVESAAVAPVAAVKAVETKVAEAPTEMQMLVGADNRVAHPTAMRSGPSPLYEVSGWLGKDAALVTLSQQGDWVHVRLHDGGRDGWIEAPLLQLPVVKTGEVAAAMPLVPLQQTAARVAAAPAMAATDEVGKLWFFNRTSNLQAGPSDAAGRIGWVGQNESATVLESQGDWRKVKMTISGAEGWVPRSLLLAALEPVNGEAIAPVVMRRPPVHAEVASVNLATTEEAAAPVRDMQVLAAVKNQVSRATVVRSGPGTAFEVRGWVGKGVDIMPLNQQGGWVNVRLEEKGRQGWIDSGSVERPVVVTASVPSPWAGSPQALAANTSTASAQTAANKGNLYIFKQTSDLLGGPGQAFERVGWVGRNESARVIGSKGDWRKVQMTISGKSGWVPETLLTAVLGPTTIALEEDKKPVEQRKPDAFSEPQRARVLVTSTLRRTAASDADMSGWVARGEMVSVLASEGGWTHVSPLQTGKEAGWIQSDYLKLMKPANLVGRNIIGGSIPYESYKDRISHGEVFNFSYSALEQALYPVPVEEIDMVMSEPDLKGLYRKGMYDKSAFDVNLHMGKMKLHGEVSVLGSSTRVFRKKSLLIKLDKQGGRWYGRRHIALRTQSSDKSMMREYLSWKLLAAMGMKVPEVHFARVRFNHSEQTTLYLSIGWMGKEFFTDNGLDPRGEFFQPNDAAHCGDLYTAEHMNLCFDKITPEDGDYSSISDMARAVVNATPENIDQVLEQYFDSETVLNWIVGNSLVTNGDTYNKNYWLYHQPAGKWTVVPWDYNLTMGRTYDPFGVAPFTVFNENFQYYYAPDVGAGNPVKDKSLRNPRMRARIEAKIRHLTGMEPNGPEETFGWYSPTVMEARIGNIAAVLGKEVNKDTVIGYTEADFANAYEALMHYVKSHDYFLKYKLFGSYPWEPAEPNLPLINEPLAKELNGSATIKAGGDHFHMVDPAWGYFVAHMNLEEPLKSEVAFDVKIEGGQSPKYLPPTMTPSRCIERSWVVSTKTPGASVRGDLMFEYIQENSRRTEAPATLHEELLELWELEGNHWKMLKTYTNEYSNTLTARGVSLNADEPKRFVACSPF
ncbi:hypothetical protein FE236_10315 [Mariprofundus erugo]|uniref:SH3 domain-containing protein n=1 Tax=Mariprofundus erugo TaxID=2528639 RepID=UPI0010FDDB5D|nr:SH3 domain-containing protein [Mariprofundus erugo]TLS75044.1 hypothetical protein FE236_10315 [Mariprofundus erugo]